MDTKLTAPARVPNARAARYLSLSGDERLGRLVGEGSERAFTELYQRYHQRLYRFCRSMLRNDTDAQDALQATFAGAFAALARGQRNAPMRPWLYRIAHNESVSLLRRRRPEVTLAEAHHTLTPSAEEVAGERERLAILVKDLGALSERQRGALVMRELGGLSHEDIARALGVSGGAAKQTIFEARQSLAEFAEGREMHCEDVCRAISDGSRRTMRGRKFRAHLRDCSSCSAFALAIPARTRDLQAIAPPLSAVIATGLLRRALGGGGHGGYSAGMATGAGKAAGVAMTAKTIASVAIVATAAIGVTGAIRHAEHPGARTPRAAIAAASPSGQTFAATPTGEVTPAVAGTGTGSRHAGWTVGRRAVPGARAHSQGRGASSVSTRGHHGGGAHREAKTSSSSPRAYGRGRARGHGSSGAATRHAPRGHSVTSASGSGRASRSTTSSSRVPSTPTRARRRRVSSTTASTRPKRADTKLAPVPNANRGRALK
jgi:RNA polymerase sigma factor (sigma-70 family)